MKKLSFSISQSSNPVPIKRSQSFDDANAKATKENSRSFVTEFNAGDQTLAAKPSVVIPPLENTWDIRRFKKMKNLDLPISNPSESESNGLQFEPEAIPADADESGVAYGLTLRNRQEKKKDKGSAEEKNEVPRRSKYDIATLPEDRGFAEFEDMPVEGFGLAVLAGYGWKKGDGVGKNAKEDVKIVEYTRRSDKQGLGFVSAELPVPVSKNSRGKAKKKDPLLGKEVRIVGGREVGLKGRVLERIGDRDLDVRLSESDETVRIRVRDVVEIGSKEEDRCLRRLKEEQKVLAEEKEKSSSSVANWVASGIRVRIVSRALRGGGLYLKKGSVVGPGTCDVAMEETREVLQGVSQEALETVVPGQGGRVLVLLGKRRGVYGSLVERDSDRGRGVVQEQDTHEMVGVSFDQIAEFIGDPSELGY